MTQPAPMAALDEVARLMDVAADEGSVVADLEAVVHRMHEVHAAKTALLKVPIGQLREVLLRRADRAAHP